MVLNRDGYWETAGWYVVSSRIIKQLWILDMHSEALQQRPGALQQHLAPILSQSRECTLLLSTCSSMKSDELCQSHGNVTLVKVKSHTGCLLNERADEQAELMVVSGCEHVPWPESMLRNEENRCV
jgi:hypothetical protein